MSTNHHTPITTGAAANASTFNAPLAELDAALEALDAAIDALALADLADVTETTPADNDLVAYDSASGDYTNQSAAEAGLASDDHVQALDKGGTNADLSSSGPGALVQASAGANVTVETLDETRGGTGQSSFSKGDLLVAQSAGVLGKLGLGTDGQVLTADAAEDNGVKWADAAAASGITGSNLCYNYPSIEFADGTQPEWWEVSDGTLTEEDAAGESATGKYERVLKLVTSSAGGYAYQQYSHAAEPALYDSTTEVSAGVWVYNKTAGTVTLELYDVGGTASLGTITTTATNSWTYIKLEGVTVGTTTLELRLKHSENAATVLFAMPMLNTGANVGAWRSRGLRYVDKSASGVINADPSTTDMVDADLTSNTRALTAAVSCIVNGITSTAGSVICMQRNGETTGVASDTAACRIPVTTQACFGFAIVQTDDGQVVEWGVSNADVSSVHISVNGYWEWE